MKQNFVSYQVVEPVTYISFAVYSADDGSLNFYHRPDTEMPAAGDTFENKTVTAVYTGFETESYYSYDSTSWGYKRAPWVASYADSISSCAIVDEGIKPKYLSYWFYSCKNLASISMEKLDTSAVTNIQSVFYKCISLPDVSGLAGWDTSNVTTMQSMFSRCASLLDVSPLAGWDVSSVTQMGYSGNDVAGMFSGCSSLENISPLAGWNTSKVTCMRGMFNGIKSTATGDLSGWNVAAVTNHTSFCSASGVTQPNWTS